jgi:hypothetical protein
MFGSSSGTPPSPDAGMYAQSMQDDFCFFDDGSGGRGYFVGGGGSDTSAADDGSGQDSTATDDGSGQDSSVTDDSNVGWTQDNILGSLAYPDAGDDGFGQDSMTLDDPNVGWTQDNIVGSLAYQGAGDDGFGQDSMTQSSGFILGSGMNGWPTGYYMDSQGGHGDGGTNGTDEGASGTSADFTDSNSSWDSGVDFSSLGGGSYDLYEELGIPEPANFDGDGTSLRDPNSISTINATNLSQVTSTVDPILQNMYDDPNNDFLTTGGADSASFAGVTGSAVSTGLTYGYTATTYSTSGGVQSVVSNTTVTYYAPDGLPGLYSSLTGQTYDSPTSVIGGGSPQQMELSSVGNATPSWMSLGGTYANYGSLASTSAQVAYGSDTLWIGSNWASTSGQNYLNLINGGGDTTGFVSNNLFSGVVETGQAAETAAQSANDIGLLLDVSKLGTAFGLFSMVPSVYEASKNPTPQNVGYVAFGAAEVGLGAIFPPAGIALGVIDLGVQQINYNGYTGWTGAMHWMMDGQSIIDKENHGDPNWNPDIPPFM